MNSQIRTNMPVSPTLRGCFFLVFIIVNNMVSSAPISDSSTFYTRLYQNASKPECSNLPKVSEMEFISSKINEHCDPNLVVVNNDNDEPKSPSSVCLAFLNLFPKMCQLDTTGLNIDTNVKLVEVNKLGINVLCRQLGKTIRSIVQDNPPADSWVVPFSSRENKGYVDEAQCASQCKNVPSSEEFRNLEKDLQIDATCLLLFEGYEMYQHQLGEIKAISKVSPSPAKPESVPAEASNGLQPDKIAKGFDAGAGANVVEKKDTTLLDVVTATELGAVDDQLGVDLAQEIKDKPNPVQPSKGTVHKTGIKIEKKTEIKSKLEPNDTSVNTSQTGTKDKAPPRKESGKVPLFASSSSSTPGTVDQAMNQIGEDNGELRPPIVKSKIFSSTAVPSEKKSEVVNQNEEAEKPKEEEIAENPGVEVVDNPSNTVQKPSTTDKKTKEKEKPSPAKNNNKDDVALASVEEDPADYNAGEDNNDGAAAVLKTPPKSGTGGDVKDIEMPIPEIQNQAGYDSETSFKTGSKDRYSNNRYDGLPFDRGTTINVSLNGAEDTGFFSYFLFSVTLVGVLYLVIHNKKKVN